MEARECKPLCQRYAPAFYQVRRLQSPGKVQKPLSSGHTGGRKDQRRVCPMSGGSQKRRNSLAGFLRSSVLKSGEGEIEGPRIFPQKQPGLYGVSYHPIGGCLTQKNIMVLCEVLKNIPDTEIRLSPDGTMYLLYLTAKEVPRILEATGGEGKIFLRPAPVVSASPSASRDWAVPSGFWPIVLKECGKRIFLTASYPGSISPAVPPAAAPIRPLLWDSWDAEKKYGGETVPAFRVFINGQAQEPGSRIGEEAGILPEEVIPKFLAELERPYKKAIKALKNGSREIKVSFWNWYKNMKNRFWILKHKKIRPAVSVSVRRLPAYLCNNFPQYQIYPPPEDTPPPEPPPVPREKSVLTTFHIAAKIPLLAVLKGLDKTPVTKRIRRISVQ